MGGWGRGEEGWEIGAWSGMVGDGEWSGMVMWGSGVGELEMGEWSGRMREKGSGVERREGELATRAHPPLPAQAKGGL